MLNMRLLGKPLWCWVLDVGAWWFSILDLAGDWLHNRLARLRYRYLLPFRWLMAHIRHCREGQQKCKVCGQADGFNFHVADEVWAAVVPRRWQGHVVCLLCFERFASAAGVHLSDVIQHLCFAGSEQAFELVDRLGPVMHGPDWDGWAAERYV